MVTLNLTASKYGFEGDDIPFQLSLLGYDINTIPNRYYFFPLVDHYYVSHEGDWLERTTIAAKSAEVVVFYDLVNLNDEVFDSYIKTVQEFDHPNKVYLTVNQSKLLHIPGVKIVQWDFMWNRTKSYYIENISAKLTLHQYSWDRYHLFDINFDKPRSRKFISLKGRELGPYRESLYQHVCNYSDQGYISNRAKGIFLESNPVSGVYTPIPIRFYQDSYFSVYVESNVTTTNLMHLTEKTFEPLIKGHFILPLTNPGAIDRLKDLGFEFPKFIDYKPTQYSSTQDRLSWVKTELNRLLSIDLADAYNESRDLLLHNQECIHTIPYDRRILEIFEV